MVEMAKNITMILYYVIISVVAIMGLKRYDDWKEQKLYDELHKKYCEISYTISIIQDFINSLEVLFLYISEGKIEYKKNTIDLAIDKNDNTWKILNKNIEYMKIYIDIYFERSGLIESLEINKELNIIHSMLSSFTLAFTGFKLQYSKENEIIEKSTNIFQYLKEKNEEIVIKGEDIKTKLKLQMRK